MGSQQLKIPRLPSAFHLGSTNHSWPVSKTPVTPLVLLGRQGMPTFPALLPTLRRHRGEAGVQLITLRAIIRQEVRLS